MKKSIIHNLAWITVLLALKFGLIYWAKHNPEMVEKWYARGIYPFIATILTTIANAFPFSIGEVIVAGCIVGVVLAVAGIVAALLTLQPVKGFRRLIALMLAVSIAALYIDAAWLLNNYRMGANELLELEVRPYAQAELEATFEAVIRRANELRRQLDEELTLDRDNWTIETVLMQADDGYAALHKDYDFISDDEVKVKGLESSELQSKSGYTGIYLFFIGEPTINTQPPLVTLPHTACHEIAHQKGFAFEEEANYIGFLACMRHEALIYQYSGYFAALRYLASALNAQDSESYERLSNAYSEGVRSDLIENSTFWQLHQEEKISKVADRMNEGYLIRYNQPEGLKSYGLFVDLLIADYLQDTQI